MLKNYIKVALRRLRKFARDGAADTLDLPGTIKNTADKGYLDISLVPERRNKVKVLLFFDIGGSMEIGRASVGKECRSRWSPYH